MTPEAWILLAQLILTIIGGAIGYGMLIAQVREVKEILKGENGIVQRVEMLERSQTAPKAFSATSGA